MRRLVSCVGLLAVLVVACGDGEVVGELIAPEGREPAPAVEGEDLDGDPVSMGAYDGSVVVVNFWASWCPPCIREMPDLIQLADDYAEDGVAVLGVNVQDSRANAQRFERELGVTYASVFDEPGRVAAAFGGIGPAAMPTTIVLDRDHRVAIRWFGLVTYDQVAEALDELIAEVGATS